MMKRVFWIGGIGCAAVVVFTIGFIIASMMLMRDGTIDGAASRQPQPTPTREYVPLEPIMDVFDDMTDIQQDSWNSDNLWRYWVAGTCEVEEVKSNNMFSEIEDMPYEVTCDFTHGNRVVLYYSESYSDYIMDLKEGDEVEFRGRLKNIVDRGFWISAIVAVY